MNRIKAYVASDVATELDLSNLGLTSLPATIGRLSPRLKKLDISGNRIAQLPASMDQLKLEQFIFAGVAVPEKLVRIISFNYWASLAEAERIEPKR